MKRYPGGLFDDFRYERSALEGLRPCMSLSRCAWRRRRDGEAERQAGKEADRHGGRECIEATRQVSVCHHLSLCCVTSIMARDINAPISQPPEP
ncbi:hypothetical protein E2C01_052711 [Portunus trituberculatus]|uniref:Uncharacterized protein n=1 Tax=Portunus trituberculatus TaxID=210409 RepID=A0A5B7GMH4_PORTR|nr:hypothetical protein [Portunus trituberculatus]